MSRPSGPEQSWPGSSRVHHVPTRPADGELADRGRGCALGLECADVRLGIAALRQLLLCHARLKASLTDPFPDATRKRTVIHRAALSLERMGASDRPARSAAEVQKLVERGTVARERARTAAYALYQRMIQGAIEVRGGHDVPLGHVAIGLAAAGMPDDISARLATQRFVDAFRAAVRGVGDPIEHRDLQIRTVSAQLWGWFGGKDDAGWSLLATRDGVAAAWRSPIELDAWDAAVAAGGGLIERGWRAADRLLEDLGAYGPVSLAAYVHVPSGAQHLFTWTSVGAVDQDRGRVIDELRRQRGEAIWT